jgi:hypothetical protein
MEQVLDTLDGPAEYYGFAVYYAPQAAPGGFMPTEVTVTWYDTNGTGTGFAVTQNASLSKWNYDTQHPGRSKPLAAGERMRLVYDAPGPIPGLRGEFLRP